MFEGSCNEEEFKEFDFYPLNKPFAYAKVYKGNVTADKFYKVIEPQLSSVEHHALEFIRETLMNLSKITLDASGVVTANQFLVDELERVLKENNIKLDDLSKKKILYYVKRDFFGYGRIDPLMSDPHIEDISCYNADLPIFIYHRKYGSLKTNIKFTDEEELSSFVTKLAQKCNRYISPTEPLLIATLPNGSTAQLTLRNTITTKGSTFAITPYRFDPYTSTDLINLHTMSAEMIAYLWLAVEHHKNALIAGEPACGKTTTLNALALLIPKESKIVSIEETQELNLPHPNWIPCLIKSTQPKQIHNRDTKEIDMYDLIKAALRQRPDYLLVGEIHRHEAYELFQAMAIGHTTYATIQADSVHTIIHRLEGLFHIPRIMLQALDIIILQATICINNKKTRRIKKIIEIIDVDPITKEILTNEVFSWNPIRDTYTYTGKSYILECIGSQMNSKLEEVTDETKRRAELLQWMRNNNLRSYTDVLTTLSQYHNNPHEFTKTI